MANIFTVQLIEKKLQLVTKKGKKKKKDKIYRYHDSIAAHSPAALTWKINFVIN